MEIAVLLTAAMLLIADIFYIATSDSLRLPATAISRMEVVDLPASDVAREREPTDAAVNRDDVEAASNCDDKLLGRREIGSANQFERRMKQSFLSSRRVYNRNIDLDAIKVRATTQAARYCDKKDFAHHAKLKRNTNQFATTRNASCGLGRLPIRRCASSHCD